MINAPLDTANEIYNLVLRGRVTYTSYLNNNKCFLFAIILKKNNDKIHDALLKKMHTFPDDLNAASLELIHHIDVWSVLWEQLADANKPDIYEQFVFANSVNYPKHFDELIEKFIEN